jgi:N6-adenosine-specific RNA methylase IME4
MSISAVQVAKDRQAVLLAKAVRDGFVISESSSERVSCIKMNAKGILTRDEKSADKWYPTERAAEHMASATEPSDAVYRAVTRRRIDTIDSEARLRIVDQAAVEALKHSIGEHGQKTPITVQGKSTDERVTLGAGKHRLEAMRQLGEEFIDCFHEDVDDLDRELWEIDENLIRSELTPADRALFTARRKEIYLLKHPETANGGDRRSDRQLGELKKADTQRFSAATAAATGQSERVVQRDAARGERIVDMALHLVRGTRLNSGAFLDRLKHVPEDKQVLYVKAALDEEKRKAADVKANRRALSEVRHAVRLTHMAHVTTNGAATAGQVATRYPVIYADPPWKFGVHSEVTGRDKSPENHYPTMTTLEICALWEQIGSPAKKDAVLFLWATNPMLPDALRVMEAWGFTYVHHWIWDKEIAGTGYWGRDRHELLLIGRRGEPAAPLPGSQPNTVHREAKGRHSAKPDFFAETIERLYPDMPRLEMFCRTPRPGWTAWGFEAQDINESGGAP